MSTRRHFVNELTLAAAHITQANNIIAMQRKRIARLKCSGGSDSHAQDFLATMLEVRAHRQEVHDQLLHALLTAAARPAMAY